MVFRKPSRTLPPTYHNHLKLLLHRSPYYPLLLSYTCTELALPPMTPHLLRHEFCLNIFSKSSTSDVSFFCLCEGPQLIVVFVSWTLQLHLNLLLPCVLIFELYCKKLWSYCCFLFKMYSYIFLEFEFSKRANQLPLSRHPIAAEFLS